jgi:hypothetical protein
MTLLSTDREILEFLAQQQDREATRVPDPRGCKRFAQVLRLAADALKHQETNGIPATMDWIPHFPVVGDRITDGSETWVVMADFELDKDHVRVWRKSDGFEQVITKAEWEVFCAGKKLAEATA